MLSEDGQTDFAIIFANSREHFNLAVGQGLPFLEAIHTIFNVANGGIRIVKHKRCNNHNSVRAVSVRTILKFVFKPSSQRFGVFLDLFFVGEKKRLTSRAQLESLSREIHCKKRSDKEDNRYFHNRKT